MAHTSSWNSLMSGIASDPNETIAATVSALEAKGFTKAGSIPNTSSLGERPYMPCRPCRAYTWFNYYMRKDVIVIACSECGIVPIEERAKTREGY